MQPNPAADRAELTQLRAENAKWRQRVPKLTEMLKLRGEALAQAESRSRRLQSERDELLAANTRRDAVVSAGLGESHGELVGESRRVHIDQARLEKDLVSLEARNRLLQQTVEILNFRLADAIAEIGKLRENQQSMGASGSVIKVDGAHIMLRIKGIGEKTLRMLQQAGIESVESLADLHEASLDDPESPLFPHRGRIRKQEWVAQAKALLAQSDAASAFSSESLPK